MKKIAPFNIWVNGTILVAQYMALVLNNDNLLNSATFYWSFSTEINAKPGNKLADGNITLDGADYLQYNSSNDSNEYAWTWAAQKLGVTMFTVIRFS